MEIKKMFSAQRAVRRSAFGTEVKQTFFLGGYNTCIVNLQNTKDSICLERNDFAAPMLMFSGLIPFS